MGRWINSATKMNRLGAPLSGLVLDHLHWHELLDVSVTCRSWRAALSSVTQISWIRGAGLRATLLMNKMTRCRVLYVDGRDGFDVLRDMILPMAVMRDLRTVTIEFDSDVDKSLFASSCYLLVRSGALRSAQNLKSFLLQIQVEDSLTDVEPLDSQFLGSHNFKQLLDQMSPDCALRSAVFGRVPASSVSAILSMGADPNAVDDDILDSILDYACIYQSIDVIRALVDAGADPHCLTRPHSRTVLHAVASMRKRDDMEEVLHYLLDLGLNARQVENQLGWTALHYLVARQDCEEMIGAVKLLLSHDSTLASIADKAGDTPLTRRLVELQAKGSEGAAPAQTSAKLIAILSTLAGAEAGTRRGKHS